MKPHLGSAIILFIFTQSCVFAAGAIPQLMRNGNATQLIVDGKPFLMIAGELHNSSASTLEYLEPIFPRLKSMHLNTVLVPVAWEQFEPAEGQFDFTLVDGMISQAKANELKLVVLWFASWKNGQSSYAPMWVKRDSQRFWRAVTKERNTLETLSSFCDETRKADARAFAALMKHIKSVDDDKTVIMIQPENEVGILQEMDYRKEAIEALQQNVPKSLIDYMNLHRNDLNPHILEAWCKQGFPARGNWLELFGDDTATREFLMAWQMANYINAVAKAGQQEYPLPMFVNAWILQKPEDLPGTYPNGGPVARVMDIYKAAAPNLFAICPDIYLPNFKDICEEYVRSDNPLLIPESTVDAGRAFYAFAEHDALCYSPFGVEERAANDLAFQGAYAVLNELEHIILRYQGTGKLQGLLREGEETSRHITMGRYSIEVVYEKEHEPCYGLVIQTEENAFLVAGVNLRLVFTSADKEKIGYIGQVWEGRFVDNQWKPIRMLNGDETYHNEALRVFGREPRIGAMAISQQPLPPQPEAGQHHSVTSGEKSLVNTPGIYGSSPESVGRQVAFGRV